MLKVIESSKYEVIILHTNDHDNNLLIGGGLEVAVARGGWKTKGESLCALFEYFLNTTLAISTAGRVLSGYPNPRVPCFPPRFSVFVTAENKDKIMKMMSDLFDHSFQITGCQPLLNFAKTMFASLLQYHEVMQNTYGMDHIIVRTVIQSAKKFGTTMKELSEWGGLVRNDFNLRNAARSSIGSHAADYNVHFNTVRILNVILTGRICLNC